MQWHSPIAEPCDDTAIITRAAMVTSSLAFARTEDPAFREPLAAQLPVGQQRRDGGGVQRQQPVPAELGLAWRTISSPRPTSNSGRGGTWRESYSSATLSL